MYSRSLGVRPPHVAAYRGLLTDLHDQVLGSISGTATKLYSYTNSLNGFAVSLTAAQVEELREHPEVAHVVRDTRMITTTTYTPQFLNMATAWGAVGSANGNNAGEDIVVGVVDTGIYPEHPSFCDRGYKKLKNWKGKCNTTADFPSCNNKLVSANYFINGFLADGQANGYTLANSEFRSPRDILGHGSNTASIAAGNQGVPVIQKDVLYGYASGMAPRARIAAYKIRWENSNGLGLIFLSDVMAAIDQAVADGVDVINFSISYAHVPSNPTSVDLSELALLTASKAGIFSAQAAGNLDQVVSWSPWQITVGGSVTDRTYTAYAQVGGWNLTGGSITALALGAAGAIFTTSDNTDVHPGSQWPLPAVYLTSASSTPDLIAPGQSIWGAWSPFNVDGVEAPAGSLFAQVTGTSQATPHIAGIAAVLRQLHPTWSVSMIKSALVTTTTVVDRWNMPLRTAHTSGDVGTFATATVDDMGAGHVQADKAIQAVLVFDSGYPEWVKYMCGAPNITPQQVLSSIGENCTKTGKYANPSELNTPYISTISNQGVTIIRTRTITNTGPAAVYTVSVQQPPSVTLVVSPTRLAFPALGKLSFNVSITINGPVGGASTGYITWSNTQGKSITLTVACATSPVDPPPPPVNYYYYK
eukprot:SM000355S13191  [mRNA]  locus=s355:24202:29654:+ [translate_table: standard]